jgi:pilus assembly protein CpaD
MPFIAKESLPMSLLLPRRSPVRPLSCAALLLAATTSLAGCGVNYASNDSVPPGDYHARYPIVVAEAPTTLDVYPTGGALDQQSIDNIRAFAQRYREFGDGRIAILAPAGERGRDARAIDQIRRALAGAGLRGYVSVGSYPDAEANRASPVRLVFQGLKATVQGQCGVWPADLASGSSIQGWKNDSYPNFGCATQSTLAAQVADPRDLAQSRASGPGDVTMRLRAIGDVREGKDPGTDWTIKNTPIGQVGGGG